MDDKRVTICVTIPGVPPSMNRYAGRENTWTYRNDKKKWGDAVVWLARGKCREPMDKAEVRITYFFKDRRRHDPDNYSGKFLLDGLTRAGVIVDDSFDHVKLQLDGGYDKENPRTEIEVEPIN